jgi:hypothetical protein
MKERKGKEESGKRWRKRNVVGNINVYTIGQAKERRNSKIQSKKYNVKRCGLWNKNKEVRRKLKKFSRQRRIVRNMKKQEQEEKARRMINVCGTPRPCVNSNCQRK